MDPHFKPCSSLSFQSYPYTYFFCLFIFKLSPLDEKKKPTKANTPHAAYPNLVNLILQGTAINPDPVNPTLVFPPEYTFYFSHEPVITSYILPKEAVIAIFTVGTNAVRHPN